MVSVGYFESCYLPQNILYVNLLAFKLQRKLHILLFWCFLVTHPVSIGSYIYKWISYFFSEDRNGNLVLDDSLSFSFFFFFIFMLYFFCQNCLRHVLLVSDALFSSFKQTRGSPKAIWTVWSSQGYLLAKGLLHWVSLCSMLWSNF